MMPRAARFILALMVLAGSIPAVAQVTEDDIARARREMERVMGEAAELDAQVQEAWARQMALEYELSQLDEAIARTGVLLADAEEKFREVSIEMYMAAASGTGIGIVLTADQSSYQAGIEYLRTVNGSGRELINELTVLREELDRLTTRKTEASVEQAEVTARLETMSAQLLEELEAAQVQYDTLVERKRQQDEEERRRREEAARLAAATSTTTPPVTTSTSVQTTTTTAPATTTTTAGEAPTTTAPPTPTGGGTCPVAGPVTFSDSWGAPRDGGKRSHEGVDMIAARGTPAVAIYSGRIDRKTTGNLSGLAVWLRADNGDKFFYAHLDAYGDIAVGQQVEEGYVLGYVGTTGNAPEWLPHLHFEWHPKGSGPVNPYPLVKGLC